jgi:hypothetical protein
MGWQCKVFLGISGNYLTIEYFAIPVIVITIVIMLGISWHLRFEDLATPVIVITIVIIFTETVL